MREIKFRAWNLHTQKMLSPSEIGMMPTFPESRNSGDKTGTIYLQFTGLKDKNGVEIYEGDIMKIDGVSRQVIFDKGCFLTTRQNKPPYSYKDLWNVASLYKVIGNIYQNPELLQNK